ncbi:ABC transporter permease [Rhodovulum euryhalinum]|uniref:ABC-2 type transport system permease protein n=1 Tax=Rhodovulum euryhalinum TaxID=35805 RepID=A0A4R2KBL1_9RHOB|nr:ABC transporter permease [Rhodovulum euryhalinum]TCO69447.1 ABC-2 type transport system permease protein [Rhodovulum euryhalinum]
MQSLLNVFWLGIKELRSVFSDMLLVALIVYSFSFAIYSQANAVSETVHNASVGVVDEDDSTLSRSIRSALMPPYFQAPERIAAREVDRAMEQDRFMFVLSIPPGFEEDVRAGRQPTLQVDIDATAVSQASLGAGYIQSIALAEVNRYAARADVQTEYPVVLVNRRAFNPNGTQSWFAAIVSLLDQLSMLTIILTGAALLREREHGTIEHLLVMPLRAVEIALAKVWANGLIILVAFTLSVLVVVEGLMQVPIAGSHLLLIAGTTVYLFAAAAIGIFLGTVARTMAQFSLLIMMTIIPMMMLSGGMTPIESQPAAIQPFTWFLPSRHYMTFAQAVVFRGAGFEIVWPQFLTVAGLGGVFLAASLALFRRSISTSR